MSFFGVFVIMAEKRVKGRIFTEDRLGFWNMSGVIF